VTTGEAGETPLPPLNTTGWKCVYTTTTQCQKCNGASQEFNVLNRGRSGRTNKQHIMKEGATVETPSAVGRRGIKRKKMEIP